MGATKKIIIESVSIIKLKIILTLRRGVASVLNRVSPSIIPVIIAITRVKGKTNTENNQNVLNHFRLKTAEKTLQDDKKRNCNYKAWER